jgi:hypothetical protein
MDPTSNIGTGAHELNESGRWEYERQLVKFAFLGNFWDREAASTEEITETVREEYQCKQHFFPGLSIEEVVQHLQVLILDREFAVPALVQFMANHPEHVIEAIRINLVDLLWGSHTVVSEDPPALPAQDSGWGTWGSHTVDLEDLPAPPDQDFGWGTWAQADNAANKDRYPFWHSIPGSYENQEDLPLGEQINPLPSMI